MGSSTYVQISALVRITEKFELKTTDQGIICPKCKKTREGLFCSDCGARLTPVSKAKAERTLSAFQILYHLADLDGEDEFDTDEAHNVFASYEYTAPGVMVPNYESSYTIQIDTESDFPAIDITTVAPQAAAAIEELQDEGKEVLALFDRHGVRYEIIYGITVFAS